MRILHGLKRGTNINIRNNSCGRNLLGCEPVLELRHDRPPELLSEIHWDEADAKIYLWCPIVSLLTDSDSAIKNYARNR